MHGQARIWVPLAAVLAGCGAPTAGPVAGRGDPTMAPIMAPVSAPMAAAPVDAAAPAPPALIARYGDRDIETACNGLDDDGDGVVDVLLPVGPNACATGRRGACATGIAICEGGQRICVAPPPLPEVDDGVDNDCNGIVDDVDTGAVHPRALVVAPRYAWADAGLDIANVAATLAQAGIPYDQQAPNTDWQPSLGALAAYTLVVIPGYLEGAVVSADVKLELEAFAARGGVVVVWKPIGATGQTQAWDLTGLTGATRHRDVGEIHIDGASPATAAIDSPEERRLLIQTKTAPDATEVWVLEPGANTEVIARAYVAGAQVGAAITRRGVGKGAIYALGHDLASFDAAPCYVNCFEPSGDLVRLFLEGALREGSRGHVVLKHTAPSAASSVLVLTHDIDAPDSEGSGAWGEAGALQAARVERARGVHATYNITTDYVAGYFNPRTLAELCTLGMCPLGLHSVVHSASFGVLPLGTCREERATYGAPATLSLCGEVRVSRALVKQVTGVASRVWRAPYLMINPRQFTVLPEYGIAYDSGFGIGDLPVNLPTDLATVGSHQDRYHHAKLLELPVAAEDGIDALADGTHRRVELQDSNHEEFLALWRYIILENARNKSYTTLLLHPSRGREQPLENLGVKIRALDELLGMLAAEDIVIRPLEEIGDFWRARLDTALDASYENGAYTGTLAAGKTTARGLTLEFGDAVQTFTCSACGETQIHGKRVVLVSGLAPGARATFTARVR